MNKLSPQPVALLVATRRVRALPHLEALLRRHRARALRARLMWMLAWALVVALLSG
jgi:hypothetical protein